MPKAGCPQVSPGVAPSSPDLMRVKGLISSDRGKIFVDYSDYSIVPSGKHAKN